jgi:haloalkane dehalogenase
VLSSSPAAPSTASRAISAQLYPFEGRFFDRGDGVRMHYLDEGQGPAALMLHGNPTWSFYYRNLVLDLRRDRRAIAPDHVGCGLSDRPDDARYGYRLADRVADVERLVDHLDLREPFDLIVHDWGGMIGMAYATRHPERIRRIVLLNTGAFPLPASKPFPWPIALAKDTRWGAWLVERHNAFARVADAAVGPRRLHRALRGPGAERGHASLRPGHPPAPW